MKVILVGGPRDGWELDGSNGRVDPDAPDFTINFGYAVGTPPVGIGDPTPVPLPKPESYRRDGTDRTGRLRFVYVRPVTP